MCVFGAVGAFAVDACCEGGNGGDPEDDGGGDELEDCIPDSLEGLLASCFEEGEIVYLTFSQMGLFGAYKSLLLAPGPNNSWNPFSLLST